MSLNDFFLVITWVVGVVGVGWSVATARKRVRADAQLQLDQASFSGAKETVDLLRDQQRALYDEMKIMRGEFNAFRAREGKLLLRIQLLEQILRQNGIALPPNGE